MLLLCFSLTAVAQKEACNKHKALIAKLDEAMAKKDATLLAEAYHANAIRHHSEGTTEGLEKITEEAAEFYKNVPDAVGENLDFICSSDRVVVRWKGSGTPVGSPKEVHVTGITIYKLDNGKIVEEWEEMNLMSLMMQMGYELKPPGEAKPDGNK